MNIIKAVLVTFFLLPLINSTMAFPIEPQGIYSMYESSTLVLLVEIGRDERIENNEEIWGSDTKTTLYVKKIFKGNDLPKEIYVYVSKNMVCPAPPRYSEGKTAIVFLTKRKDKPGYYTTSLSYGLFTPHQGALIMLMMPILELKDLTDPENKPKPREIVDWILRCLEHETTAIQGILKLSTTNHSKQENQYLQNFTDNEIQLLVDRLRDPDLGRSYYKSGIFEVINIFTNQMQLQKLK